MRYRIYFSNGRNISINQESFDSLAQFYESRIYKENTIFIMHEGTGFIGVNIKYITHLISEEERDVPTGVTGSPTPDQLKDKEKQALEAIKGDPKAILQRAIESQPDLSEKDE